MKYKFLWIILGVIFILILASIFKKNTSSTQSPGANKLSAVASFYPLYFFASEIGGNKLEVQNITPAGAEPHDYEPTSQEIAQIERSKLLILNGGVETWGNKIQDDLKEKRVPVVIAGEGLFSLTSTENGQVTPDTHIWLSPPLAKIEAQRILSKLITIDPQNSAYFEQNAQNLENKLDQLDQIFQKSLSRCQKKEIITSHAAFGYLAKQYGLNQVPIAGLSPDSEPSPQQLAQIAQFARQHQVKYIFFESLVSPKLAQTLATEVGAQTLVLDPLEGLSNDDLRQGKNYFTKMEQNLNNLQIALECSK